MRKIILILLLFISIHKVYSQEDSLLKKFKFRNVNYRAITFEANGSGEYNNTDYAAGRSKNQTGGGSLRASYYIVKSTDRILLNAYGAFNTSLSGSRSDNSSTDQKHRSFYFFPQAGILNKWFSKKIFTELGAEANMGLSSSRDFSGSSTTFRGHEKDYFLSFTAGIGQGRLETITDMQNALWLNDALKKEGGLSRDLSATELNGLGHAIIKANNTRVLDLRKRTQFILETVDAYLQQNGLIDKTDIKYFSNLNDILFFAINYPRLSGTEKYIRFTPSITRLSNDQSNTASATTDDNRSTTKSARLSIGIKRYIPVNLRHQNNYGIGIFANYLDNDADQKYFVSGVLINETKTDAILRHAGINLFFEHAIYPNTRTAIGFNLQSEGGYEKIGDTSTGYGNVNLFGWLNYFISYRTRFTGNLGVRYQKNEFRVNNYFIELLPDNIQLYANAGIQVSL